VTVVKRPTQTAKLLLGGAAVRGLELLLRDALGHLPQHEDRALALQALQALHALLIIDRIL
jgi:hypothetical protein